MISLVVFSLLLGADLPPGHPGMGGMPTGAPTAGPGLSIQVNAHSTAGRRHPAAGAEVRLEQLARGGMDDSELLERVWVTTTDDTGTARFDQPELPPGRDLRAVVRWEGVEWPTELQQGTTQVEVYAVTSDRSKLKASISYGINVSEDELFIEQQMQLSPGGDPRAVDVDREGGVRVPLLEHAVFGDSLDEGWVPPRPDTNMTLFQVDPPLGRLVVERGAMVYRGLIPPDGITIRATYPVPYVETTDHVLAARSPVAIDELQVSVALGQGLDPEIALRTPFETMVQQSGDGTRRFLRPLTVPKQGEVFFVDVRDTPSRMILLRPLAIALGGLVFAALTVAFLRTRRRGADARAEAEPTR